MGLLAALPILADQSRTQTLTNTEEKIRKELVTLPFYDLFDTISFRMDGDKAILMGYVTRPTLRSSAENVVKRIEGVTAVDNQIEVLPLSPFDNQLRFRLARALYSQPSLQKYGMGVQPSIRIIVKNGDVILAGTVLNEGDKNIANIRANQVSGVFSVKNELTLEEGGNQATASR